MRSACRARRSICACASTRRAPQALARLAGAALPRADVQARLDAERRATQALEVVLFGEHERILAASLRESAREPAVAAAAGPGAARSAQHVPYVSLEPQAGGRYLIRTAAALDDRAGRAPARFVVAIYPVPAQLAALAEAVQRSYSQYGDLAALREPLKYSFRLTLTLVLLLAMLAAIYGAIYSAQRLVRPVQDLIAGTRAVGKGDFATRLPLPSRDEMGFLVHSFNDMTKRLRRARAEATREPAGGGARARAPGDHPGAPVDRRARRRPQPDGAHRQPGGRRHPRRRPVGGHRAGAAGARRRQRAARAVRGGARGALCAPGAQEWREQLDLDGASRAAHAHVRLHAAARRGLATLGVRDRVRRHHHAAAGAARCRLGRSGAAPGARDQEPAHPDPAVGGAPAARLLARHERARRARSSSAARAPSCSRSRPCSRW